MAPARARSHAAQPHEEAPEEAATAPEAAPEPDPEVEENPDPDSADGAQDGVSGDVQAAREAHANLPKIQSLDARVEESQPEVLERLSRERKALQLAAVEGRSVEDEE